MAGWKDFREIAAWQYARDLKIRVDEFLERPNVKSKFRLHAHKEFARYARIAKGSEVEVLNHLIDLRDQRLISEDELLLAEHAAKKTINAVVGLIRHLENTPDPPRAPKRENREP